MLRQASTRHYSTVRHTKNTKYTARSHYSARSLYSAVKQHLYYTSEPQCGVPQQRGENYCAAQPTPARCQWCYARTPTEASDYSQSSGTLRYNLNADRSSGVISTEQKGLM